VSAFRRIVCTILAAAAPAAAADNSTVVEREAPWIFGVILAIAGAAVIAPATASTNTVVFFHGADADALDPEQWRVAAEAGGVLENAVATYRKWGESILLAGHDDYAGTEANAIIRSVRRAEAVKEALIARGVPASALSTKACGWTSPLVETAYGVRDAQNRYVWFWWYSTNAEYLEVNKLACEPFFDPR
jgi:outer membrane protein OmpA-like peptidoglycan-associated protein